MHPPAVPGPLTPSKQLSASPSPRVVVISEGPPLLSLLGVTLSLSCWHVLANSIPEQQEIVASNATRLLPLFPGRKTMAESLLARSLPICSRVPRR